MASAWDATTRATELWPKVLEEFEPAPQDPTVVDAIQAYVGKRKEELEGV